MPPHKEKGGTYVYLEGTTGPERVDIEINLFHARRAKGDSFAPMSVSVLLQRHSKRVIVPPSLPFPTG